MKAAAKAAFFAVIALGAAAGAAALISARRVDPTADPAPHEAIETTSERAEALRKEGRLAEAEATAVAGVGDVDPKVKADALGTLGRIHLAKDRYESAFRELEEAAAMHRAAGRREAALRDEMALTYALIFNGRHFVEARSAIARARPLTLGDEAGAVRLDYYEGLLAYETGDVRNALRLLRASSSGAARLNLASYRIVSLPIQADLLRLLGRNTEGQALLDEAARLAEDRDDACERADLATNAGWFALQTGRLDRASEALTEAASLHAAACPNESARANADTNLALLAIEQGLPEKAKTHLAAARARERSPDARLTAVWIDLEGRQALISGDAESALSRYDELARLAEAAYLKKAGFRASLGRAEALEIKGDDHAARAAYEASEAALESGALAVPIEEGREGFSGSFDESAKRFVAFLAKRDPRAAATAARRSRARALRQLQWIDRVASLSPAAGARWETAIAAYASARERIAERAASAWKVSESALAAEAQAAESERARVIALLDSALAGLDRDAPSRDQAAFSAPASGELVLVYHPVPGGFVGIALTEKAAVAHALRPVDPSDLPADLARALLSPFERELSSARRLRVLASGSLDAIDLHALPFSGAPLVAKLPVAYGVDLRQTARPSLEARPLEALIIADPRGDLPSARREAEVAYAALTKGGFSVTQLVRGAATEAAVREAMASGRYERLHYAGHGSYRQDRVFESELPLAGSDALTIGDLLALGPLPSEVVLSGCETARTSSNAAPLGLGLGHAFIVSGSASVVAARRPVSDDLARRMMEAFYAGPPEEDATARLRRASLLLAESDPTSDWASFRVLVP